MVTRLGNCGGPRMRYGSFAGKSPAPPSTPEDRHGSWARGTALAFRRRRRN